MRKTWGEIKKEVIRLGFERQDTLPQYLDAFVDAYNEAQKYICENVEPIIEKITIVHNPLNNIISSDKMIQYTGTTIKFEGVAQAYTFEVSGKGSYVVKDDNGENTQSFDSVNGFVRHKGFCSGNTSIEFEGDYNYLVRNIAMYDRIKSDRVEDIPPYSLYTSYDMNELTAVDDVSYFMSFADDRPIYEGDNGERIETRDYQKEKGHIIMFKTDKRGQFDVYYNKYPAPITKDTLDTYECELNYDLACMLPYRMAYRVWLDDEERKAIIYNNEFVSMVDVYLAKSKNDTSNSEYINTTGWWG